MSRKAHSQSVQNIQANLASLECLQLCTQAETAEGDFGASEWTLWDGLHLRKVPAKTEGIMYKWTSRFEGTIHNTTSIHDNTPSTALLPFAGADVGQSFDCSVHIGSGLQVLPDSRSYMAGTRETTLFRRIAGVDNNSREVLPALDLGLVHPVRQLEVPPGQPCLLGAERLRLGRIPQGAVLSRVISIRNCLQKSVSSLRLRVCSRFIVDAMLQSST